MTGSRARRALPALLAVAALTAGCTSGGEPAAAPTTSATGSPTGSAAPTASATPTALSPAEASASAAALQEQVRARLESFPEDFRPAAEAVYDAVQPLHDAFAAFADPREDTAQVRDDVFAAGGAAGSLRARREELAEATSGPDAGAQLRGRVAQLTAALTALEQAATQLSDATRATPGPNGTVAAYVEGERALRAATEAWRTAITPVYAGRPPEQGTPTLPAPQRGDLRAPLSKGSWLRQAGRACGAADGPKAAAAAVREVPVPPREAERLRPALTALEQVQGAEGEALRAARIDATAALAAYGSSTCVDVLRVAEG